MMLRITIEADDKGADLMEQLSRTLATMLIKTAQSEECEQASTTKE
ncbi:MAG: hypothetical protein V3U97_01265 [bacterium]